MKRLDIRRLAAVLSVVLFGFVGPVFAQNCASTAPVPPVDLPSCSGTVPRYGVCEIKLTSARSDGYYSNPFTDVNVTATFTSVGVTPVQTLTAYGFHDGGKIWRVRFSPKSAATGWTYTVSNGGNGDTGLQRTSQSFTVGAASGNGFIEVDPTRPYFRFSNGTKFFGFGDTSYGMVSGISDTQRKDYIQNRSQKGFNFIRFNVAGVPKKINANVSFAEGWPWKGTLANPDYTRINPQYFRRLERVLAELKACNMYAEVIMFAYSGKTTSPMPANSGWTTVHQALWERYVVSRLSAYDRVFLWTVANEYDTYPDAVYEPFTAADNTWAKVRAAQFHLYDPLKHPTTVHPWESPQTYGVPLGGAAQDIGPRFGNSAEVDVLSQQHWGEFAWSTAKGCLDELPGIYPQDALDHIDGALRRDRKVYSTPTGNKNKPVVNTESPYERLLNTPSYPQAAGFFACPDKTRRSAWRVFLGGGATYANGFSPSFLGRDPYDYKEIKGAPFSTNTTAGGMGNQLIHFVNFVNQTNYRDMNPAQGLITPNMGYNAALCLAKPGTEYIVYAPAGGTVQLDLRTQTGKTFAVTRLDPRSGVTTTLGDVTGGGSTWKPLTSPAGSNDYVFRVKLK